MHLDQLLITTLKGVGPRSKVLLNNINLFTVADLLFHLPLRYEDRTRVHQIATLKVGDRVLVEGVIEHTNIVHARRTNLLCRLKDDTGSILLRFFHFSKQQKDRLSEVGTQLRCFGEVRNNYQGHFEMIHPEYKHASLAHELPLSDRLTAIYPTTKGLSQITLRKLIDQALSLLRQNPVLPELLPEIILKKFNLLTLQEALEVVHRPPKEIDQQQIIEGNHPAQKRLAFEELVAHHLSLQQLRSRIAQLPGYSLSAKDQLSENLRASLPFELTAAQQRVHAEVKKDLSKTQPMLRLVQGDVGCGKTIVAALAAACAVENGYQVALMAPTELLAEQHTQNFIHWFSPLGIKVGSLCGKLSVKERQTTLKAIAAGEFAIVVGTHALFQSDVNFANLALLIIDEQHRFGVHQRLALKEKGLTNGYYPHQLIMTATPIPRTLAMAAYADLDYSVIDELPPGRKPVNTILVSGNRRAEIIERVRVNCQRGKQAYWVCTLITESDTRQCQAAEDTYEQLVNLLPELTIGLIHGRLKPEEKDYLMRKFSAGKIHLLVATTVIEVGVDVPNASLMIVENAERLGLAQLHQLRGRVGRNSQQSHCVLMYQHPLSLLAKERLKVMRDTCDGFQIAERDLEMRGPGEMLGVRQAGMLRLRVADIGRDATLLPHVHQAGKLLLNAYPKQVSSLVNRWIQYAERYARV